ncbi:MAG: hypothetical protein NC828_04665, partial [Candidatus Omnitrophica bacterium]|nr:hypothetical protein [Candidatus Omnitrophota bacterium]
MDNKLLEILNDIKKNKNNIYNYDETSTKQVIILKLLHALGWNIFDREEVYPEYSMGGKRVDYSLRINGRNKVFLEVKKPSEPIDTHEQQLLEYSFRSGVKLACLSNGITWSFYLPLMEAEWHEKKFYTVDLIEQDASDVADKIVSLLKKDKVESGESFNFAEELFKSAYKEKTIKASIPEAWNKIISDPPASFMDIIADLTEKLCGFRPTEDDIAAFLSKNQDRFKIPFVPREIKIFPKIIKPAPVDMPNDEVIISSASIPFDTAIHLAIPLK